ncbi:MAG: (Fe-S)-binding protein [Bacillota bacterium]|nr:(Fe-S)-binding protein [Bacillota bacterium]
MAEVNMEQLLNCALCPNMCRCECPAVQTLGREAVAPAGKARIAAMLNVGHLEWNEELLEAVANCLGCRGCTIHCPFPELNLCDELLFTRLEEKGKGVTLPSWTPYLNNLKKYGSPYGQKPEESLKISNDSKIIFFAGCTSIANHPQSIEAAKYLFENAGISYQMIDEDCCGYPAETWGDIDLAKQLASENRRKMIESGAKVLVTNCPECWSVFTDRYAAWGFKLPLEIIDGPSYFLSLIRSEKLKPEELAIRKVSYHDPCIWARTAQKTEEPRETLKSIPGLKLEEPFASKELTRCCGGGRMFQLAFPKTANEIAKRRLAEFPAEATIVTACPFCREGLIQDDRQALELVELLAAACGKPK